MTMPALIQIADQNLAANFSTRQREIAAARLTLGRIIDGLMSEQNISNNAATEALAKGLREASLPPAIAKVILAARDERGRGGDGLVTGRSIRRWLTEPLPTPKHAASERVPEMVCRFSAILPTATKTIGRCRISRIFVANIQMLRHQSTKSGIGWIGWVPSILNAVGAGRAI